MTRNPLHKKLRLDMNQKLLLLNCPQEIKRLLAPLPAGCEILEKKTKKAMADLALVFAASREQLEESISRVLEQTQENSIIWMAYPKKSGNIESDLSRNSSWDVADANNMRPVSQISLNEDWSAVRLRFKHQVKPRPRLSRYVDFEKRVVQLPPALDSALTTHNLHDDFNALSFTQKKECVLDVEQAKREETRNKRIEKIINTLKA